MKPACIAVFSLIFLLGTVLGFYDKGRTSAARKVDASGGYRDGGYYNDASFYRSGGFGSLKDGTPSGTNRKPNNQQSGATYYMVGNSKQPSSYYADARKASKVNRKYA